MDLHNEDQNPFYLFVLPFSVLCVKLPNHIGRSGDDEHLRQTLNTLSSTVVNITTVDTVH